MNKKCTLCDKELDIENFPIINYKTNKISSRCGECKREYDRKYWEANKNNRNVIKNENTKINRNKKRKFIVDFLKTSKCFDCENNDWRVLEFDHRDRKIKEFNLANSVQYSIERIQKEIDKCDVVCANCHRIRTIKQRGYYNF